MNQNRPEDAAAVQLAALLARGPAFDRRYFRLWQQYGFHITPNHYYEPVPDTSKLSLELWTRPSDLPA